MTAPPSLRPLSGPEIIDAGIQLARRHYAALVTTAVVPLLPYFAMDIVISSGRTFGAWQMVLFSAVWASIADAATGKAAFDAYVGLPPSPTTALGDTVRQLWPVVASGVYRAVMVTLGVVLFIVPGLYVLSTYALVPLIAVLEPRLGAWAALRRSTALTAGARRRALVCYVVPYAFVMGANVLVSRFVQEIAGHDTGRLLSGLLGSATAVLLTPVIVCLQVVFYLDCRVRKEALDLEWEFSGSPAPVTSGTQ